MRTIIDIPEEQIKILDALRQKQQMSRAAIIRQAIKDYLDSHSKDRQAYHQAFGLWSGKQINSVEYQQKLREEWE